MRKVLSFVLVLALVMSSFSMAFATTTSAGLTDIAGNANEDAIQVCYDLGIITGNEDGTFLPDKTVNRAEFAAMLTRALAIPDSALAGYTTTSFKDTTGYTWAVPYLAFCQSKGILLGDGNGNVMPGETITVNAAMTMALRAIGYTANSALLVGTWPANYVSIAQNEDLYDEVATETTLNKAYAAQIIYNLLTVQKVAVNSDGTTDSLTTTNDDDEDIEANLLNTNLGCTAEDDAILGQTYSYDDAIINITDDIGAYGTAYLNDDDELVAFTKDSTALTGTLNDDMDTFTVGDVDYDIDDSDNEFTGGAFIANTDASKCAVEVTTQGISTFALAAADDGATVTLNVDLSGKKIKYIYSVVAWEATDTAEADSDVQDEITEDHTLLDYSFVEDDDDAIDNNSFELVGVTSLEDIAEDDVVYVYVDESTSDEYIRKVAVGTETVEGTIDELNDDCDVVTIADTDYDVAYLDNDVAYDFDDEDVSGDGTFYLDAFGQIYDYDGTSTVNTYGVVKASTAPTSYDNFKIKLYKSDDSTSTLYLSEEEPADIDWTTDTATALVSTTAISTGALIGYSLDSSGDIDAIDNTMVSTTALTFKSSKLLSDNLTVDSSCVVFTYGYNSEDTTNYDVAGLDDIDAGDAIASTASPAAYILNEDGDVIAMFIAAGFANATDDAVYGVINSRKATTNDDGDSVYKFTGYIDGTAFTYKTDDDTGFNSFTSKFGVYAITLDTDEQITEIAELDKDGSDGTNECSWLLNTSDFAEVITDLASDNTVITTGSDSYTVADDAVVYKYDTDDEEYTVSKLSSIDEDDIVSIYDTKGEDQDGIGSVVIYIAM